MMIDIDGYRFKKFMQERRLGPSEMADACGISRPTVYRAMKEGKMSLDNVLAVLDTFKVGYGRVFGYVSAEKVKRISILLGEWD